MRRRYLPGRIVLLLLIFCVVILIGTYFLFWPMTSSIHTAQTCAAASVFAKTSTTSTQLTPPLYLGLDAYRHWDKLSYLEVGDRVEGQSTADTGGSNADNTHTLGVLPNDEHVLFDQVGPGIVTFMRMQEIYGAPWKLSLDDHAINTVAPNDFGQMKPDNLPASAFPYPLSLNPQESQGSSILATALPFRQSFTWTSQHHNGNFYALYRKLPYGTALNTWNSHTSVNDVVGLLRCAGSNIAPATLSQQSGKLALVSGKETSVVTLSGPAQIRFLSFSVPRSEMVHLGNVRLRIRWDGETHPSVDAPLKFLIGDGAGVYQPVGRSLVQGWIAGAQSDSTGALHFNLYWPMPFSSQAHIALVADSPLNNVSWNVGTEPFADPPRWWGTFHATYTQVPHPQAGQDMTFLDVSGSGKLVGTVINFSAPDGTLEGDPHLYIDESQTPQIAVTGTEEWGEGGNYWNGGQQVSLPLGGLPSSTDNPPGSDRDGAALYRFLIADSISFNRHLTVRWEHGGADERTHPYRATMLWYGTPTPTAALSDDLSPTEQASRQAHAYQNANEQTYQMTAGYEYTVHSASITSSGTATTASASFTMRLAARNVGAFLRRTFDDCVANQRANIYLDNAFAGTWYDAGSSTRKGGDGDLRCWRDEDFPLPASLTSGKSAVTVRVEFVPTTHPHNSEWTAFHYQMYCFVLP